MHSEMIYYSFAKPAKLDGMLAHGYIRFAHIYQHRKKNRNSYYCVDVGVNTAVGVQWTGKQESEGEMKLI